MANNFKGRLFIVHWTTLPHYKLELRANASFYFTKILGKLANQAKHIPLFPNKDQIISMLPY